MYGRPALLGTVYEQCEEERKVCNNCPLRIGNVACATENYVEAPVIIDSPDIKDWFKTSHDVPTCKHPERSRPIDQT
ncbi:MAG TPA: hypothetical protein P5247_03590 [Candidatus Saccharimonadales bacterium]|nr:hypothetical protein [Candidatus Saccharimonadales bacterium]